MIPASSPVRPESSDDSNNKKKKSISGCFSGLDLTVAGCSCCTAPLWIVYKKLNLPLKDLVSGVETELDRRITVARVQ